MTLLEEKMHGFELTKRSSKRPTVYADASNQARILIDHPHAYRTWRVIGEADAPGFWILESVISLGLDFTEERMHYQRFELVLPDTEFERIQ
jgi:hypothetical protein